MVEHVRTVALTVEIETNKRTVREEFTTIGALLYWLIDHPEFSAMIDETDHSLT